MWEADADHEACRVSPIPLITSLAFFAASLAILWLLCLARRYVLRITDLSVQSKDMVLTTRGRHRLQRWRKKNPPVEVWGTAVRPLHEISEYHVKPLHGEQLVLLHPEGKAEPWDTSMGELRLRFPHTLFHVRFLAAPLLLWLILSLCSAAVALLMPWPSALLVFAVACVVFSGFLILKHRSHPLSPIEKRHQQFLEELKAKPKSCERGPERAIQAHQLEHFHTYFQAFIRDRSMYYVCSNLVEPLTKASQVSYAELVGASLVQWFVSHYWGSPFRHFSDTIRKHAASGSQAYWICTFSNNQWDVETDLGNGDVLRSSFYLSLPLGAMAYDVHLDMSKVFRHSYIAIYTRKKI